MVTAKKFQQSFINEYMAWSLHDRDVRELGKAEGIAEGAHNNAVESAKRMLMKGLSIEQIAEFSGLSESEVKGLL